MKQGVLNKAKQIAHSLCPTNREIRTSHIAFLIKSNIIEKIGFNKRRTHPEVSKHPYHEGHVGIHAELDCILKVDKEDLKDYKMLVLRVDRKNKLNYKYYFEPLTFNLIKQVFTDNKKSSLTIEYSNYKVIDNNVIPQRVVINAKNKEKELKINLNSKIRRIIFY